jgi:hypothetical protein
MTDNLYDMIDEFERENQGSGNLIGFGNVSYGYKCYISGLSNAETWFGFTFGNEESKKSAMARAKELLAKYPSSDPNAKPKRPQSALRLLIYKDKEIAGHGSTWKEDRQFVYPTYTEDYLQIVKPSIVAAKLKRDGDMWLRLSFRGDVAGTMTINNEGKAVPKTIAYLAQVYDDENECREWYEENKPKEKAESASGEQQAHPATASEEEFPSVGYALSGWKMTIPDIKHDFEKAGGPSKSGDELIALIGKLAEDYTVAPKWIKKALGI